METPKGLAKALVNQALKNPELNLRVRRYAQIPGTFGRSREVLFPMENTYRSVVSLPEIRFLLKPLLLRPSMSSLENMELVSQSEDLEVQPGPRSDRRAQG